MDGSVPVLKDVVHEIDDQQRVDRPLDGLLNLVYIKFAANYCSCTHRWIILIRLVHGNPRL
jgi:hypothetical protein